MESGGFCTKENLNSESELSLRIAKVKVDELRGYLVISETELEDINTLMHKLKRYTGIVLVIILIVLTLDLVGLVLDYESALTIGLGVIASGLLLEYVSSMNLVKRLLIVVQDYHRKLLNSTKDINQGHIAEVYVFYSEEKYLERAENLLRKILKGKNELQEYLLVDARRTFLGTFPSRILLLLGLILIARVYLFVSVLSFVLLGGGIFLMLLDLLGVLLSLPDAI